MEPDLSVVLVAVDGELAAAWRRHCADLPRFSVYEGSILDVDCDAVVSPANSFGFMQGGIDAVYRQAFGASIERRVQAQIREHYGGELVVGEADVVETESTSIPYLIVAPTMRVPMPLEATVNPYLAARAVFRLVVGGHFRGGHHHGHRVASRVHTIALPGMGTGTGGVAPATCAAQVRAAYDDAVLGPPGMLSSLDHAIARHRALVGDAYGD